MKTNIKLAMGKAILTTILLTVFFFAAEAYAASAKLERVLAELQREYLKKPSALRQIANSKGITITNNKVTVYLVASGKDAGIIDQKALKRYGAEIQKSFGNVIRANVPVSNLQAIANKVKGVSLVQLTSAPGTSKIQNTLRELEQRYIQDPQKALNYAIEQGIGEIFGNKVRVYLTASGDTFDIIDRAALTRLEVNVEKTFGNVIRALVPMDKLQTVANQVKGISFMQLTKGLPGTQLTGITGKLQDVLRGLQQEYIKGPINALNYAIAQGISEIFGHNVRVYLTAAGDNFNIIDRAALSALGVNIEKTFGNVIRALVPMDKLQAVANQVAGIANIQLTKALVPYLTDQQITTIAQGLLGPQAAAILEAMGIGIGLGSMGDCCCCCPFC